MSFSCSSEIADVIAFLIFLFDVEKHTVFQTSMYVEVGEKNEQKHTSKGVDLTWEKSEEFTVKMKRGMRIMIDG